MPYGPGGFNYAGSYTQRLAWGGPSKNDRITSENNHKVWLKKARECRYRFREEGYRRHWMCDYTSRCPRCMYRICPRVKKLLKDKAL